MLCDRTRTRSGDMSPELQDRIDRMLDEFMQAVDAITQDRHLQKGIARSQLPSSMVAILDRDTLSILAQFRKENRVSMYLQAPKISLTRQSAANSAQWEFGFEDPFVIQFPAISLEQSSEQRRPDLEKIASEHIDSEFVRLMGLLSLMRTRPIFGAAPPLSDTKSALILLPLEEKFNLNKDAILRATMACGLVAKEAKDMRNGKSSVYEAWMDINQKGLIIADLTGADPQVMYALGIAHTIGKETILICPQGLKYLTDIPRTYRINYKKSKVGRAKIQEQLSELLRSLLASAAPI
jgi:hypothetical protein